MFFDFFCGVHFRLYDEERSGRSFSLDASQCASFHRKERYTRCIAVSGCGSREISGWSLAMSANAGFWSRFEERVAPFNLLQHPFYQAWSKGELTREDLREYAAEDWHHVSAFPT